MSNRTKIGIGVVLAVILGYVGYVNGYIPTVSFPTSSETTPVVIDKNKEKPGGVVTFTNDNKEPIGHLIVTDTISFQGNLDISGILFMSYIASQMGLHCEELKEKFPIKQDKVPTEPKKK